MRLPYAISMLAVLAAMSLSSCDKVTYRFILPAGYIGWVRVDFEVKSAPPVRIENNGGVGRAVMVIPESGILQTNSVFVTSTYETYEMYYQARDRIVPMPGDLYAHKFELGGFNERLDDASGANIGLSWYFFIGPKSLREKDPTDHYLKYENGTPRVGRMGGPISELKN